MTKSQLRSNKPIEERVKILETLVDLNREAIARYLRSRE
jgi:hypothetical protein